MHYVLFNGSGAQLTCTTYCLMVLSLR